jgi:very-short-patch-repair endonuclease
MDKIFNKKDQKYIRQCLRRNLPTAEILLWNKIKSGQLKRIKFRRQHGIGQYVVDFYCPLRKLVIEIDGNNHFTSEGKRKDFVRDSYLRSLGIKILRFNNQEVVKDIDLVLDKIYKNI